MSRILIAASCAALLAACGTGRADPLSGPRVLRIAPGQSISDALRLARLPAVHLSEHNAAKQFQPAILGGAVVSGTMVVGQANSLPTLQMNYQAKSYGLNFMSLTFTSPNGLNSFTFQYNPRTLSKGGTVTFTPDTTAPYYAQPGQWQLTSAIIVDNQYNFAQYTQAQLASIFTTPYVTVVNNGPVDIVPPVVTAGQIITPTVSISSSPSPSFEATLTGTDNDSGIEFALVTIQPPGSMFSQVEIAPAPFVSRSGTFAAYAPVYPGQPTGTWSITGYSLCDVADNCFSDTNTADIATLFGTSTFQVTN